MNFICKYVILFSAKGKEVAYLLASDETVQREFGAYDNIRDFLLAEEWN